MHNPHNWFPTIPFRGVKMHDKVRKHWELETKRVEREIAETNRYELRRRSRRAGDESSQDSRSAKGRTKETSI